MKHKKQHTITSAYLKEWCDPNTPSGQTPYVWRVSRKGEVIDKKAPKNIFRESDFYTIIDENGNRNLDLEHSLQKIENDFISARKAVKNHQPISNREYRSLVFFIATTYARTELQKRENIDIWIELLNIYQVLDFQKKFPDLYRQVEQYKNQPMPFHLFNFINTTTPILLNMNLAIFETSSTTGFITSDTPVIWFDPSLWMKEYPKTFYGLGSPWLVIMLPITPNYLIQLSWNTAEEYISIDNQPDIVDVLNKMVITNSEEYVIMNHNKPNPYWFDET